MLFLSQFVGWFFGKCDPDCRGILGRNDVILLLLVVILDLLLRLSFLPFAMAVEADGIARVWTALKWIEHPTLISSGIWPPLHFYMLALPIFLTGETICSPILVSILSAALTSVPTYIFIRNEYKNPPPFVAVLPALVFVFYPLAFRYSLMAMSEMPFIFLVAVSIMCLSIARRKGETLTWSIFAGVVLAAAGLIRYESWFITPLLALALWPSRRCMLAFLLSASTLPIYWLAGNYIANGDALAPFTVTIAFQHDVFGLQASQSVSEALRRFIFMPAALFWGMTPPMFVVCVIGAWLALRRNWRLIVWLTPAIILLVMMMVQNVRGTLFQAPRYTIIIAFFLILLLPPLVTVISRSKLMIFSFCASILAMPVLSYSFPILIPGILYAFVAPDLRAVPRFQNSVPMIAGEVANLTRAYSAYVSDAFTYLNDPMYIALMTRLHPNNILILDGFDAPTVRPWRSEIFFREHPKGALLVRKNLTVHTLPSGAMQVNLLDGQIRLAVVLLNQIDDIRIFEYQIIVDDPRPPV